MYTKSANLKSLATWYRSKRTNVKFANKQIWTTNSDRMEKALRGDATCWL